VILENILLKDGNYYIIDNEWLFSESLPYYFIFFKGLYLFYRRKYTEISVENFVSLKKIFDYYGLSEKIIEAFKLIERNFQIYVNGNLSFHEIKQRYSKPILRLNILEEENLRKDQHIQNLEAILRKNDLPITYLAQLFIDTGSGFNEEQSIVKTVVREEQQFEFDLSAYQNIKQLRFDPINTLTVLQIAQITILDHEDHLHLISHCRAIANFYQQINGIVFETNDPQMLIEDLRGIIRPKKITIRLKYLAIGNEVYKILLQLERNNNPLKRV
jgi:hypothetical protein